jgi:beta-phosphoglucomutase-like phosphatase (HAD superfamily)
MNFPNLGELTPNDDLIQRHTASDDLHVCGQDGVRHIAATGDGKVEFIGYHDHTLALVNSSLGYPAYYPVLPVAVQRPLKAVLMDLDGTSVHSEVFWIWIIQLSIASLLGNPRFELEEIDLPFVSGHSVSEHLQYCIEKYCPDRSLETARTFYFEHTHREMQAILDGHGRQDAFLPSPGLKDFLLALKAADVKIALVTSGLYEKAYPEIYSVFQSLSLGRPEDFYDAIITAGFPLRQGEVGTMGELAPKPHPWLYAEAFRVGLGMPFEERHQVVGIEDSGAGVCAIRLAGFTPIGVAGGNIIESGTRALCGDFCQNLDEVLRLIVG